MPRTHLFPEFHITGHKCLRIVVDILWWLVGGGLLRGALQILLHLHTQGREDELNHCRLG